MAARSQLPTRIAERLAALEPLDAVAGPLRQKVRELIPPGPVKDALRGTWLGHAVHPVLQLVPVGTWTSAVILDVLGGRDAEAQADLLIGTGLLAAAPTFATGWSDYADDDRRSVGRIGLVHAGANATGAVLFAASLRARGRGARGRGKLLAMAGIGAVSAGGWIGGHLAYAEGMGYPQRHAAGPEQAP